jgi:hypothetical protein
MTMKRTSHRAKLEQRIERAVSVMGDRYDQQLHTGIRRPRSWPEGFGTTYRENGEVVEGSFRNIFDTGELDNSQSIQHFPRGSRHSWSAPHAVAVHEGATLTNGTRIPARRFTYLAAMEARLAEVFAQSFREGRS